MNVGIGTEAAQFLFREYIEWIIGIVRDTMHNFLYDVDFHILQKLIFFPIMENPVGKAVNETIDR